jgi:hypothetical protein
MEPEGSSPCSQELAICPYPEPNESNPHPQTLFPIFIIFFQVISWLVTLPKLIYASVCLSNIFILIICLKFLDFVLQISPPPPFVPESLKVLPASRLIAQFISIHLAGFCNR